MQNERFDRFSQRARQVLALAHEEAQRFNHNYIGTEHLLLGLVREGEGVAAKVLGNLGVDVAKVRNAVEFIIGRGDRGPVGEIGLTPRARRVIELATDEARRLGHRYIGTEHLLLGLVREGEGIAAGVLQSLGVNLEKVRQQTITVLSRSHSRQVSSAAPAETVTCRLDPGDLAAIDLLVGAGVRNSREEVVVWLVKTGLLSQSELLMRLKAPSPHQTPPATAPSTDDPPKPASPGDQAGPPPQE
jgi:ATP-dependent Clp protease ATP-binding subunit ClpC